MPSLLTATWPEINAFRDLLTEQVTKDEWLTDAAQHFTEALVSQFPTVALARVFAVLPFARLPESDANVVRAFATRVDAAELLRPSTPVLSLLGTSGTDARWNDRYASTGHLAIPLLSKELVEGAPMLARLLADLKFDLADLAEPRAIDSKRMMGGTNQRFFVPSAKNSVDERGRFIIPSREFVDRYRLETVFGMGGAYFDGTLITAILFTTEQLDSLTVDRYPSIISNFRMATTTAVRAQRIYRPAPP